MAQTDPITLDRFQGLRNKFTLIEGLGFITGVSNEKEESMKTKWLISVVFELGAGLRFVLGSGRR